MGRKKKVIEPELTPREQLERYLFEGIAQFEEITGVRVNQIDISHRSTIGFEQKNFMEINLKLD